MSLSVSLTSKTPFFIGSDPINSLVVRSEGVEGQHCRIEFEGGDAFVWDCSSQNGTFLNGKRVERSRLGTGDRIRLGVCELVYENPVDESSPSDDLPADSAARMQTVGETFVLTSHRFNNLFQGINGGTHLVDLGLSRDDLELVRKGWSTLGRNQTELANLVANLMRIGKPMFPIKRTVDLVQLIQASIASLEETLTGTNVTVRFEPESPVLEGHVDDEMFSNAVESLIRVAVDACRHECEPAIQIELGGHNGGFVRLRIDYRGARICLEPSELTNSTEPDDNIIGGVGFALGQRIVGAHGGSVGLRQTGTREYRISIEVPEGVPTEP